MNIIDKINEKQINPEIPEFRVGDTVRVDVKIKIAVERSHMVRRQLHYPRSRLVQQISVMRNKYEAFFTFQVIGKQFSRARIQMIGRLVDKKKFVLA